MNKATVTIQATRDDDGATWRITVPADVLEQAVNDVWFLSYVNLLRQSASSNTLRALYTIMAFAQFAEGVMP